MERRTFLLSTLGAVAGLGLTACSGMAGTGAGQSSGGKTSLTAALWDYSSTPEFKALFTAFQAANPGTTVQPVDILSNNYEDKITTMLAGGDSTDVLTVKNVTDYSQYATRGQLADISSMVTGSLPDASLGNLAAFDLNNKYFAAPYRNDFWVLFYNKDLFDKAGVAYPDKLTWTEYATLAKQLSGGKTAAGAAVYGAYHHTWRSVVQAISSAQTGGNLIGGHYEFFTTQYQLALDMQKSGAVMDYALAKNNKVKYQDVFESGQAAMVPMGSWLIAAVLQDAAAGKTKVNWGIAPMPQINAGDKVTTFGSPTAFAVNKNAANADAARKFVQFAASEQGAKAVASVAVVPALQSAGITQAYFANKGMVTDAVSKSAFQPDSVKLEMPVSPVSADIDQILTEEHDLIMVGQKSIADGIAEMNSRVQKVLANQ